MILYRKIDSVMQMVYKLSGAFYMSIPNINNSFINFTTLGNLQYLSSVGFIQSLNYFNGANKNGNYTYL